MHTHIYRVEINSLRSDKPNANERRTVAGSRLTTSDDDEGSGLGNEKNNDDDSNDVVGDIADDRLDKDDGDDSIDNAQSNDAPEEAASIFKKLLSIHKGKHDVKNDGVENSAQGKSANENVITPTRILNGRQVSLV